MRGTVCHTHPLLCQYGGDCPDDSFLRGGQTVDSMSDALFNANYKGGKQHGLVLTMLYFEVSQQDYNNFCVQL